jgi:uncharacterized RDD family membrane protein YckC
MTQAHGDLSLQGNYSGAISRLVAFAADLAFAWLALVLIVALTSFTLRLIVGHPVHLQHFRVLAIIVIVLWAILYFSYQWSLSGKTLGMALFGLKVVTGEGAEISSRAALIRTLMLPFSIAILGLGLFGIVLRVDHRGWHDQVAGTCVVYNWDARGARLRWLARQNDLSVSSARSSRQSPHRS